MDKGHKEKHTKSQVDRGGQVQTHGQTYQQEEDTNRDGDKGHTQ